MTKIELKDNILSQIDSRQICKIANSAGINFSVFDNGAIQNITCGSIQINLMVGSPLGAGCCNLYLRKRSDSILAAAMLGPSSPAGHFIDESTYQVKGQLGGVRFKCRLLLAEKDSSWLWSVQLVNTTDEAMELDLISVQDIGLSCADGNEKNDYYISQYIDYTPLWHKKYGHIVCCRQNEHGGASFPWLALGSISRTNSFSTDGAQFFGPQFRQSAVPRCLSADELPGLRQGEFGAVSLQIEPFLLKPGQSRELGFFGIYIPDHTAATSRQDLKLIDPVLQKLQDLAATAWADDYAYAQPAASLFSQAPSFTSQDLDDEELNSLFGGQRRHSEVHDGRLLSFFYADNRHVVLRSKELLAQRPCAHILKTGSSLVPDETIMSCSCYMFGAFLSHLAQGNVNCNRVLTINTNAFNIFRHTGLRIFIKQGRQYEQLAVPSAFEMSLGQCRWIYKHGQTLLEVVCRAERDCPQVGLELHVLKGPKVGWLISSNLTAEHHWQIASNEQNRSIKLAPGDKSVLAEMYPNGSFDISFHKSQRIEQIGGDEMLFNDSTSRGLDFVVIKLNATDRFAMRIDGRLTSPSQTDQKNLPKDENVFINFESSSAESLRQISRISEILPWFCHNAQIHYLAPRGLEQYGGAAWGTRDICQGPVEMLLAMGRYREVRKILAIVFANQNADGNWAQWWMFDRYSDTRASESHGDVVLWPLIALGEYIQYSTDYDFLNEVLPYYSPDSIAMPQPQKVTAHIMQAIEHILAVRFAGQTKLVNYSDGDWNDSMQPANAMLKKRLISSWTVTLSYYAFKNLAKLMRQTNHVNMAEQFEQLCGAVQEDFNRFLMKDGVVAGFGLMDGGDKMDLLLHPADNTIGIHYSLLPMTRGILSGIFTPQQAGHHAELIEKYLTVPDGTRLMDKPIQYHGGLRRYFKRAETSPYFGREIGLMYTHTHLRYAQALAHLGHADAFVKALHQAVPINIQQVIAQADIRQANCYYSSSDADFSSRYEVNEHYDDLVAGRITVNGGWRVYSSGPGMFVGLVIRHLLGLRRDYGCTIFDPVMPVQFDGLATGITLLGKEVELSYSISPQRKNVSRIEINGKECDFDRESNPYRTGGAVVPDSVFSARLDRNLNSIIIYA